MDSRSRSLIMRLKSGGSRGGAHSVRLVKANHSRATALLFALGVFLWASAALAGDPGPATTDLASVGGPPPHTAPAVSNASDDAMIDALDAAETSQYWDPLERGNRVVFSFNEFVDHWALGPVSDAYGFIMPDPGARAVRRMFRNLTEPISFANHMLQFHPDGAGRSFVRFCLNSTVGVAGMFDVANKLGMAPAPTDFGGTLYRYGAPAGPYLVLPLMGPTTARDTVGDLVDSSVTPQNYLLSTVLQLVFSAGNGITARHEANDGLTALRDGAVDFYAALRSAYYFNRESELRSAGATGESPIFRSSAETSASNPSRSNSEVYSDLRSASSETVPLK
jgi:phospholipid-binding lipoprotein MlaA